ncbi:MFS transporter, FSR family, fosmidomycin resistance protein [Tistlia consotensis]|uniref:MFS transporter, FSR family, fosmidomycin resistance protein n=1 Tax=Tistlia consotensis USBA 355 TaxID=560819 RepID=A0A1Y6BY44_9PROT|nr:MFS transporter [Tistlia consotensis]SMF23971.1 MFS transporter, FSR family, fosmidomycin resistance protein [Tistlia consotensis USBA 355]SNR61051.1 MFS transporter, FSR family, fosmidomycin resistance protein [Tistlia consotensis]
MSETVAAPPKAARTAFSVLGTISFCHLLNDMLQSLLPAIYPILKGGYDLSFAQIGLLTLTYQVTASLLQPLVGLYTDGRPTPFALPVGMGASLLGLVTLAFAPNYPALLAGGVLLGLGSSIFHPEASRMARAASGGAHGLAQSVFQVGGNFGSSLGPLLAAFVVLPRGQTSLAWFAFAALAGMVALTGLGHWYRRNGHARPRARGSAARHPDLTAGQVGRAMTVLGLLILSKYLYLASITSYYIFYLIHRFGLSTQSAQLCLFVFLAAVATGTVIGGPIGDRIGRKTVIWVSILGVLPFTLALPYVGLPGTIALSALIGLLLASAFPAIVVFAQELMPGRVGMVSGLFFGLAFGTGGIGAAALGLLADRMGIDFVYEVCSFLPLLGLLTAFLPDLRGSGWRKAGA